jgi:hypothetical protein
MVSLDPIIKEVCSKHRPHTLILYGSWARGDATPTSDCDLLAIRKSGTRIIRDARRWRGLYLDVFVYPQAKLVPEKLMHVRGGKVLKQRAGIGDRLLARLDSIYRRGPKPLPPDELAARKTWHRKMLERVGAGDVEGNFRRAWLLTALLEDYFAFRNRWYEGPKLSLQWLSANDPDVLLLFQKALEPRNDLAVLRRLISAVTR